MGRRKIEIRAIKDDRNRSVTFLKRKGGLFKKAHELSVLCSVDVAVIIFGHNKKLYQFSSGDMNETLRRYQYYGPPHEHKGPGDFKGKGGGDDDDDDEEEEEHNREDSLPPSHGAIPQHILMANRPSGLAVNLSGSPPMNGYPHRSSNTPQPPHMGSRPSSRNTIRRSSSNLVPIQHPHATPPPPQNGFAYAPNPPIYNPSASAPPPQPSPQPQYQQYPQHSTPQPHQQMQQQPPPPPQQQQPPPPPPPPPQQQQQQQQQYMPEQQNHTPPTQNEQFQPPPPTTRVSPPAQQQQEFRQPEVTPPQIKHLSSNAKSRSIFTPIDEGGSVLAQHFFGAPDPPRSFDGPKKENSPEMKRNIRTSAPPSTTVRPPSQQPRPSSSLANEFRPPQRSDTNNSLKSGARPKLNLTIPSEASDDENTSNSPGHRSAVNSANPARLNGNGEHHNLILPPPSPSASAVLSAGASGPPNPFARPPPPTSTNNNAYNENRSNNLETPISALPSRYMDQDLLASPGGLFGSWANFSGNNTILPSPNVSTPLAERGLPSAFGRGEKREGDDSLVSEGKRIKT